MNNRIRAVRKGQGLTLSQLAERCSPPTTPQTVGRLETGMRTLSLDWLDRIAAALKVAPEGLLASDGREAAMVVAQLSDSGAEPLAASREAVPPGSFAGEERLTVIEVTASTGDYRAGDRIWLRELPAEQAPAAIARAMNRDVLVPRPGGRFVFGRLIDRDENSIAILPTGAGQRQTVVSHPAWVAVAVMLVRMLED